MVLAQPLKHINSHNVPCALSCCDRDNQNLTRRWSTSTIRRSKPFRNPRHLQIVELVLETTSCCNLSFRELVLFVSCVLGWVWLQDATNLSASLQAGQSYDHIIFNFPHAGVPLSHNEKRKKIKKKKTTIRFNENDPKIIASHQALIKGFLCSAKKFLTSCGTAIIVLKSAQFARWNIANLAKKLGYRLETSVKYATGQFLREHPGYINVYGSGPKISEQFPIGECARYTFRLQETC